MLSKRENVFYGLRGPVHLIEIQTPARLLSEPKEMASVAACIGHHRRTVLDHSLEVIPTSQVKRAGWGARV